MLKLVCQVIGSPNYCVSIQIERTAIVAELKDAIQLKTQSCCPAPELDLFVLRKHSDSDSDAVPDSDSDSNADPYSAWLHEDDPDLDALASPACPRSVLEMYARTELLMKPRRTLALYFHDASDETSESFARASVHVLVRVPDSTHLGSQNKSTEKLLAEALLVESVLRDARLDAIEMMLRDDRTTARGDSLEHSLPADWSLSTVRMGVSSRTLVVVNECLCQLLRDAKWIAQNCVRSAKHAASRACDAIRTAVSDKKRGVEAYLLVFFEWLFKSPKTVCLTLPPTRR